MTNFSISSILAEFKLRTLEERILTDSVLIPSVWYRYVDVIFIVWDHGLSELDAFLNRINNKKDPNIKFTIEIENNNELSFLDVMLIKNLSNPSVKC